MTKCGVFQGHRFVATGHENEESKSQQKCVQHTQWLCGHLTEESKLNYPMGFWRSTTYDGEFVITRKRYVGIKPGRIERGFSQHVGRRCGRAAAQNRSCADS